MLTTKLTKEIERLVDLLPKLEPGTEQYRTIVEDAKKLVFLRYDFMPETDRGEVMEPAPEVKLPWEEPIAPMQMPEEKSIIPKEEPIIIKNVDEVLTKDVVRARLQGASEKGVHIQPIIAKFVPDGKPIRFSSVPESEYTALIKELYDAQNK